MVTKRTPSGRSAKLLAPGSDEQERQTIAARFFQFCAGSIDPQRLAVLLNLSNKQVGRLQSGANIPQKATAERMKAVLDDVTRLALMTDAERNEFAERRRAEAETRQRLTSPLVVNGLEEKEIPPWFDRVRRILLEERWEEGRERLLERHEDPQDWANVPDKTKAYVLAELAVCNHKTGRFVEASDFARKAIELRQKRHPQKPSNAESESYDRFMAVVHSNLGASRMQLGFFDEALSLFEQANNYKRNFFPAYYNAVCAMSLARDETRLVERLGALRQAAQTLFSPEDIEEIVSDTREDKDLVFARELAIFEDVIESLADLAKARRSGQVKPQLREEGDLRA
jgi:tetratricopeptide (TPR) repeat protein